MKMKEVNVLEVGRSDSGRLVGQWGRRSRLAMLWTVASWQVCPVLW